MGAPQPARAQVSIYDVTYRPPRITYRVLHSQHFDLIYQTGAEDDARATAAILEASLPGTRQLVGLEKGRLHMPVVLNAFNDRSNGFVRAFPFKQEIERTGIKGSVLGTRFSSWLHAVASHELTHAAQAEVVAGPGLGWLVRPFAPDWNRALNLFAPPGLTEGAAVYRESRLEPGAGRLHAPLFTMKFWAVMAEDPWSLAQMMERPRYTRPYDRFYIGGAHFFETLAQDGGARSFRQATRFFNRMPLLGYGAALWRGTGTAPPVLGKRFRQAMRARALARLDSLGPFSETVLVAGAEGRVHRRPRWLDNETLFAYVQGYHTRPGFYRIDAATGRRARLAYETITEDYFYSFDADTSALLFARYVPDATVLIQARADLFRLDLESGEARRLTKDARLLAPTPAPAGGGLWALKNEGPFNRWVHVEPDGAAVPLTDFARGRFQHIAPSPDGRTVAVLLNVRGHQGLFRAALGTEGRPSLKPWLLFEDAAIYDASWGPQGRWLLFAADPGGVTNIYALDTQADRLLKLTNVPYGALEPSLSPDGRTLAFVNYQHERFDLVQMPFAPAAAEEIPRAAAAHAEALPWQRWLRKATGVAAYAASEDTSAALHPRTVALGEVGAETRPYRAWRHLAPRMVYPTLHYETEAVGNSLDAYLGLGAGVAAEGTDPLQRWAYRTEAFYQARRLWGTASVQTGRYLLRPSLTFFNRPFEASVAFVDDGGDLIVRRTGVEERGAALGLRAPVILESNVFQTYVSFFLDTELRQTRLINERSDPFTDFRTRLTLTPAAFFAYRLQSNPRDLVPNTGLTLRAVAEVDAWTGGGATPGRALQTEASLYLPFLKASSTGLRLGAGLLTQDGGLFDPEAFVPRGYEDEGLGPGTFARLDLEATRPLWYIDDGFVLVPLYFKALYAYSFAQTLWPLEGRSAGGRSAVGAGLGLQLRLFHHFDAALRLGAALRLEDWRWVGVAR